MPFDVNGHWYPQLSPKQIEVYNCYKRYILVCGPRWSSKTWVNLHRIVKHAVETPNARVGMFTKTIRNAKSGGVWNDITSFTLPEWFEAGQTQYTSRKADGTYGPKQDPQSRMVYFKIKNYYGGESEFQLHSIDNMNDVEAIAKATRFSCFYFAELSNFLDRMVFTATTSQLRMPHLEYGDHMWIADTNPAEEGEDSWIYKLFYGLRGKDNPDEYEQLLLENMALFEIMIPDNPFLSEEQRKDIYANHRFDKDLWARYVEGKWVRASKNAIFLSNFSAERHIFGDASNVDEKEWSCLTPSDTCSMLLSGWDLGDRFHSAHIGEQVDAENGKAYWIIDEVCAVDPDLKVGISEFCEAFMKRRDFWMKYICGDDKAKRERFEWHDWSDSAALTNYRAGAETYDKNLVLKYTNGDVELIGAPKFPGSIGKRITIVKILLFETRLIISARCVHTIAMFKSLRAGTGAQLIAKDQKYRHVFDSLSYMLSGEEPAMLMMDLLEEQESRDEKEKTGGPIMVPL